MPPRASEQRAVWLDVQIGCQGCARTIHVSGPRLRAECPNCEMELGISAAVWVAMFRAIDERSFPPETPQGETFSQAEPSANGVVTAHWRLFPLTCAKCQRQLSLVEPGTADSLACAACSTQIETFPAPAWLRTELPTAMQLYAAAREGTEPAHPERGYWMTFQGTPPALSEQRRQVIEAAIGPAPLSQPVPVSVGKPLQKRRPWEWYLIAIFALAIGFAVWRCSARIGASPHPDDGSEVEPSPS